MTSPDSSSPEATRRQHLTVVPPPAADARSRGSAGAMKELLSRIRRALRTGSVVDLMAEISNGIEVWAAQPAPEASAPGPVCGCGATADSDPWAALASLTSLIDLLAAEPFAETTAAIRLVRDFITNDEVKAHANDVLRGRRHPVPVWLAHLDEARVEGEVLRVLCPFGDHESRLWGVRLAGGERLAAQVVIDHSMGGAVSDAAVCAESFDDIVGAYRLAERGGTRIEVVDAAATRVIVEAAMSYGMCTAPGVRSATWPMHRSAVLWALRLMPEGGTYDRHQVTDEEIEAVVRGFFASPYARRFGPERDEDAVRVAAEYAADRGADPLLWSPHIVQRFLLEWAPRALEDDLDGELPCALEDMPYVLGALIPFVDEQRGLPTTLTEKTLRTLESVTADFYALTGLGS